MECVCVGKIGVFSFEVTLLESAKLCPVTERWSLLCLVTERWPLWCPWSLVCHILYVSSPLNLSKESLPSHVVFLWWRTAFVVQTAHQLLFVTFSNYCHRCVYFWWCVQHSLWCPLLICFSLTSRRESPAVYTFDSKVRLDQHWDKVYKTHSHKNSRDNNCEAFRFPDSEV